MRETSLDISSQNHLPGKDCLCLLLLGAPRATQVNLVFASLKSLRIPQALDYQCRSSCLGAYILHLAHLKSLTQSNCQFTVLISAKADLQMLGGSSKLSCFPPQNSPEQSLSNGSKAAANFHIIIELIQCCCSCAA